MAEVRFALNTGAEIPALGLGVSLFGASLLGFFHFETNTRQGHGRALKAESGMR